MHFSIPAMNNWEVKCMKTSPLASKKYKIFRDTVNKICKICTLKTIKSERNKRSK